MSSRAPTFELPRTFERYLAALSKLYAQEGKRRLQEVLVNAQVRIHEEWSSDNWNGGTYGHAVYLVLPEPLYLNVVKQKEEIRSEIKADLNKIHSIQNEFIAEVFLEMDHSDDSDWRATSGLLIEGKRVVLPNAVKRIWGEGFRIFLCHKSSVKKKTTELKDRLGLFGVSAFVAHEDIHPTKAWQAEIENALATMDGFVALLTDDFHESDWTDQEVGFAFATGVPIITVRLGKDPYGFIEKFQALACGWETAAVEIAKLLINHDRMFSAYCNAIRDIPSWDNGNIAASVLPNIDQLTDQQIDELVAAYNETAELHGAYGFNGQSKRTYGDGLVAHLNRLGSRKFKFLPSLKVSRAK